MTIKDFAELYGGIDYIEVVIFTDSDETPEYIGDIFKVPEGLKNAEIKTWDLGTADFAEMTFRFYL